MKREEYGLLTFKSTHLALQGERIFKERDIVFKTIPTPREVSHSCGLALLFISDDIEKVKEMVKEGILDIDGLYSYIKEDHKNIAEKLL